MTSEKAGLATGAEVDLGARRRNVPGAATVPGIGEVIETDDKKSQPKKVRRCNALWRY
jgi:hypothetical protein